LPAVAGAKLALAEVLEAKSEPELVHQIDVELRRRALKLGGIVGIGASHGEEWRPLDGGRAAPHPCSMGDRTLRIDAERPYFEPQGNKLGRLGGAPDTVLFARAQYFREGQNR
jgi:hypothetical protein